MKLVFDGDRQYHPATGLELVPGEHEYPDGQAEALLAAGLRKPSTTPKPARAAAAATSEEK